MLDGATIPATPSKSHPVSRLPAEFFSPPESFDAVSHMLDSLPDQLTEQFLEAQISQTQVVLDSISSQLSARVMRSYGAFVHGMSQVQQIESDLTMSAILCRTARRQMGRVQDGMVSGSLQVLAKLKRKSTLDKLAKLLGDLSAVRDDCAKVQAAVQPDAPARELPVAAALLIDSERRLTKLRKLKQVKRLGPKLADASARLQGRMHEVLRRTCAEFDAKAYGAAVEAALLLERLDDVVSQARRRFRFRPRAPSHARPARPARLSPAARASSPPDTCSLPLGSTPDDCRADTLAWLLCACVAMATALATAGAQLVCGGDQGADQVGAARARAPLARLEDWGDDHARAGAAARQRKVQGRLCAGGRILQRTHAHAHAHAHATPRMRSRRTPHAAPRTRAHAACTHAPCNGSSRRRAIVRHATCPSRRVSYPFPFHSQLHEEYFDACLAHSFYALLRVLRSQHHRMVRVAVLVAPWLTTRG